MIKIGELAKVCNTSIQTLRYYDRHGILCADVIDNESGYRYYKPEKVKVYQTIVHLKEIGFTLAEIKEFLDASYKEQCRMYELKKRSIQDSIRRERELIKRIDAACENPEKGLMPLNNQMLSVTFEDDPAVIGKWSYCGYMDDNSKFTGEDDLTKREVLQNNLYFLPGGGHVWMYFWTKGILYYCLKEFNAIVPNNYKIFTHKGATYMAVDWMVDRFMNADIDETVRIYRQVDTRPYSERETREFRDDISLPFVADERLLGEWETVDVIWDRTKFTADSSKWSKKSLWIAGMKFYDRGICAKTMNNGDTKYDNTFTYTAGVILKEQQEQAEHYEIQTVDGVDYLIVEHKSGDYSYLGKVYCYYVFRRK